MKNAANDKRSEQVRELRLAQLYDRGWIGWDDLTDRLKERERRKGKGPE